MRIAIFGDIHGNTVALGAVLEAIDDRGIDLIVCLGDLAANGPDPAGAVEMIADLGCLVVGGNADADMVSVPEWWAGPAAVGAPETVFPVVELSLWCAEQLTDDHRAFLAGLPPTVELELGGAGSLLAFHGSPRSATDVINADVADDELAEMLDGASHDLLVGGHTHVPMVRNVAGQLLINPGAVGAPFAEYGFAGQVPVRRHAAFGLITVETKGSVSVELATVPIDEDALAEQARSSEMPDADWWLGLRQAD